MVTNRISPENIISLKDIDIFVFGSNLAGAHGGGAARTAFQKYGAIWGQGVGRQGQSYAIPTMNLELNRILTYIDEFIIYAQQHPELTFMVTSIGCGIAGFHAKEIAPLFKRAVKVNNIYLPAIFWNFLQSYLS
ncbi:MAG: hypothetical protein RR356_04725 [Bacteroidales bacterium]